MQSFKPDCIIYLAVVSEGKPQRHSFAVSLVDGRSRELFTASKFTGLGSRAMTELQAAQLGLEQAVNLKREKVELRISPGFSIENLRERRSLPREPELKSIYLRVQEILNAFRFRRVLQVPAEQCKSVIAEAQKANTRKEKK